jgi:ABC-type uncharacterized transport system permease subunit
MRTVKVALSLLVFIPAFAMMGAASALDTDGRLWVGLAAGTIIGMFFGLVFGGVCGRLVDAMFGPEEQGQDGKPDDC